MAASLGSTFRAGRLAFILKKNILSKPDGSAIRCISTSNKNKDTSTAVEPVVKPKLKHKDMTVPEVKNWVSYGFSYNTEQEDVMGMHFCWFTAVTMCLVGGAFILMYQPDHRLRDWTVREAFLELHRREKLGLPLIDEDLVPKCQIILPSDEELGESEIVI